MKENSCLNCEKLITNPKFCSRSCSASYSNRQDPKRKPQGSCHNCGTPISRSRKYCNICWKTLDRSRGGVTITVSESSIKNRRKIKEILVEEAGGKCLDCGLVGPPFVFDFDHRNQKEKSFAVSQAGKGLEARRIEAQKCDLVCANCHRMRTHKQRCSGCEYCI